MSSMSSYPYTRLDENTDASTMTSEKVAYFGMTGTQLNIWVTVACTTAMTLFGYDQGVFGGIIVTQDFLDTMGNPNSNLQGTIVSLYDVGCFFGAIAAFAFGEQYGRKKTFFYRSDHHVNRSRPTNLRILSRTNDCRSVDHGFGEWRQHCDRSSVAERNVETGVAG